jgi:hypothetical protein
MSERSETHFRDTKMIFIRSIAKYWTLDAADKAETIVETGIGG